MTGPSRQRSTTTTALLSGLAFAVFIGALLSFNKGGADLSVAISALLGGIVFGLLYAATAARRR